MASFTPKQQNWIWYANDAAEPTTALALENKVPDLASTTAIIRCRVTIAETGGKGGSGAVTMEYSVDNSAFVAFGTGNAWNYADGAGSEANTVTTNKCSDTAGKMHYHETATLSETWVASTSYELDFAIAPTATCLTNKLYYFRFKIAGTEVPLNTAKTHPTLLTVMAGGIVSSGTLTKPAQRLRSVTGGEIISGALTSAKTQHAVATVSGALKPTGALTSAKTQHTLSSIAGGIKTSGTLTSAKTQHALSTVSGALKPTGSLSSSHTSYGAKNTNVSLSGGLL